MRYRGRRSEPQNLAAAPEPEQQELVAVVQQELPARPSDACTRQGLRRVKLHAKPSPLLALRRSAIIIFWKALCTLDSRSLE